jgi:hypothetical protein
MLNLSCPLFFHPGLHQNHAKQEPGPLSRDPLLARTSASRHSSSSGSAFPFPLPETEATPRGGRRPGVVLRQYYAELTSSLHLPVRTSSTLLSQKPKGPEAYRNINQPELGLVNHKLNRATGSSRSLPRSRLARTRCRFSGPASISSSLARLEPPPTLRDSQASRRRTRQ